MKYLTTPIYYATGLPHLGHIYCTKLMNVMAAHARQTGHEIRTLTGMDEHGEKVAERAKSQGLNPQSYVDGMAQVWREAYENLNLKYDIFMRTTDSNHRNCVQSILAECYAKGDIYFGEHEGQYCLDCEDFLTSKDMDDKNHCLIHKKPTELRKEGNYYFKLSKYMPQVIEALKAGLFVPNDRFANEAIGIAENLVGDLSISRPKTRTEWGIELPFDNKHVAYVWFDALPNYLTGVGGLSEARNGPVWQNTVHVLGKDILKFHAVYWPAMLLALGLPLPRLLIHGWILSDGHKMSKSLGNTLGASDIRTFGMDAISNVFFRLTNPGDDFEISKKLVVERFNADLANGIGNLLSRSLTLIEKNLDAVIPDFDVPVNAPLETQLVLSCAGLAEQVRSDFAHDKCADALAHIWECIALADKYIAATKPWAMVKQPDLNIPGLKTVMAHCVMVLRCVAIASAPFFPEKMTELAAAIGEPDPLSQGSLQRLANVKEIKVGFKLLGVPKLFQRMEWKPEVEALGNTEAPNLAAAPKVGTVASSSAAQIIELADFAKCEIRAGRVVSAEIVDGSDKLLKISVSLGALGRRQIFSGIRAWVKPEEIAGCMVLVVANLSPRKMKFGMSEGMILSTEKSDGSVFPVTVSGEFQEGSLLT